MDEPRIKALRALIKDQIEAVAEAVCEGNSPLAAALRLEWLTRELTIEESAQSVITHQSRSKRLCDRLRWGFLFADCRAQEFR
ncbi:hypothetical protein XH98_29925 [Bradyrhizobium sp. CCBAU 51745]|uniref:hypothetical protein n=1 Tax=Bradyrhizobium sp. CCBAU 51745 TaxID=1325099 RepID=UPI00230695F0|nr:hypothetical protein [Bradyrhizobium sp. CCBAU 51745]MDA9443236.1 hypothetical protein [Bradyrhizobium sp. CCBAU 51745]